MIAYGIHAGPTDDADFEHVPVVKRRPLESLAGDSLGRWSKIDGVRLRTGL